MIKREKIGKTNIIINFKRRSNMILVLFLCCIIIIIMLFIIITIISTIHIQINNLEFSNIRKLKNNKYKIVFSMIILKKVKWLLIKIDKRKLQRIINKIHLEKINIKKLEREFNIKDIKELSKIEPKIRYLNMDAKLGLDDVILTSYLIPIISTIFAIIMPYVVQRKDVKNIKYNLKPLYNMKNVYDIKLDICIEIKVMDILNVFYNIYKSKNKKECKNIIKNKSIYV